MARERSEPGRDVVQPYGMRDVERLLGLPRSTIRALISAGFVSPARGPRGAWQFSFQDLIVLRTAQALADAQVPQRRITRSMRELRRHLPDSMPLSGLRIGAVADRVVVREGAARWQAETGQYVLEFEADPHGGGLSVVEKKSGVAGDEPRGRAGVEPPPPAAAAGSHAWFAQGVAAEAADPAGAREAYERAIAADPALLDAHINLGRLLHEKKQLADAERAYRRGLAACGDDAVLLFNLGVLLDDLGRVPEALDAYERAVRADPALEDGHYNLALLCERVKRPRDAIRHMARYRALTSGK